MTGFGHITYTEVVNQVRQHGWQIESQTPDATRITKKRGAPGVIAVPLALIPLVGLILATTWIAVRGSVNVTIERKRITARVHTPSNQFDINDQDDLDLFFNDYSYRGSVGYAPVIFAGGAVIFVMVLLFQFGGGG